MSSGDSPTADFNPSPKPDKNATKDEQWTYLQKAITYVMAHPEGIGGLGPVAINVYTVVYDFCDNKNPSPWVQYPPKTSLILGKHQLPEQMHERLVYFLVSYFEDIYQSFESLHGHDLLAHYAAQFDRASASANQLDRVFNYLNRQRVCHNPSPKQLSEYKGAPRKWIMTVKATVFDVWRSTILARLQEDSSKLTSALLDIIYDRPEYGEEDAAALVNKILESLIMLDGQLTNPLRQSTLFQDHFQSQFLADWDTVCLSKQTEVGLSMVDGPADSSVQLQNILQVEIDRMARYLPECTQKEVQARAGNMMSDQNNSP